MSKLAPTFAQLGDAATPEAHASGAVVDDPRDEIPMGDSPADFPQLGRFAWRMTGQPSRYPNQARNDGAAGTATVAEHESVGQPDPRRQYNALTTAGYPRSPERTSSSKEEWRAEPAHTPVIPGVAPLTAPRAGSVSSDPAHAPFMPLFLYDRPFDQWAAHHPPEVSKLGMPSPLASSPITQSIPTQGATPMAGGVSGVTTADPTSVWRNTIRMQPTPYDDTAVVGTSVQALQPRKWRL